MSVVGGPRIDVIQPYLLSLKGGQRAVDDQPLHARLLQGEPAEAD